MSPSSPLPLADWNWAVLMLTQALIGVISPNFRMVELAFEGGQWVVRVTLAEDDRSDREEVADACDQMSFYLEDVRDRLTDVAHAKVVTDVIVSKHAICMSPVSEPRVVFRMREL